MNRVILDGIINAKTKEPDKQFVIKRLSSLQKVKMLTQAPFGQKHTTHRHLSAQKSAPISQLQSQERIDSSMVIFCRLEQLHAIFIGSFGHG